MRLTVPAFTAVVIFATAPALAASLPASKAAFSADVTFETGGHESFGHVNIDGAKERRTTRTVNSRETTVIIRRDLGEFYKLNPQRNVAIEMRTVTAVEAGETGAPGANIDSLYAADAVREGQETVSGVPTTKYHVTADNDGVKFDARVWATDDGIIARIVGVNPFDNTEPPARMELSNISRGPQDPALFEVPKGAEVISASKEPDEPAAKSSGKDVAAPAPR